MGIKIDKNIPIPTIRHNKRGTKTIKYPFHLLKIGESFIYSKEINRRTMINAANMVWKRGEVLNKKFVYAKTKAGIRIWRTKKESK